MSEAPKFEISLGPKMNVTRSAAFGGGRPSQYPWDQLLEPEVGEDGQPLYYQFFVPGKTTKTFSGAAQSAGARLKRTFTVRAANMEIDGVPTDGVLVQRVEYREPKHRTDAEKAAMAAKRAENKTKREAEKAAAGGVAG